MALNAYHIRSHPPPQRAQIDNGQPQPGRPDVAQHQPVADRPGLGHARNAPQHGDDDGSDAWAWRTSKTGESIAAAAAQRINAWFVRATSMSDPSLQHNGPSAHNPDVFSELPERAEESPSVQTDLSARPSPQLESMSQLYAALTPDIDQADPSPASGPNCSASHQSSPRPARPTSSRAAASSCRDLRGQAQRQGTDWFVSKALAKLHQQRSREASSAAATTAVEQASLNSGVDMDAGKIQPCPYCGESLPPHPTPLALALHRQSITHRLGLNTAVSSASASDSQNATPVPAPAVTLSDSSRGPSRTTSPPSTSPDAKLGGATHAEGSAVVAHHTRGTTSSRCERIRSDNVGYGLLARMGWKEGMGLGIEEWKWQQLVKARRREAVENAQRQRRASTALAAKFSPSRRGGEGEATGQDPGQAIILSSDDDDDDFVMETSTPQGRSQTATSSTVEVGPIDWWQNLPRISGPADDGYDFGDDIDQSEHDSDGATAMQQTFEDPSFRTPDDAEILAELGARPSTNLTPIDIDLKTDRRGLGMQQHRATRRGRAAEGRIEIRSEGSAAKQRDDEREPARHTRRSANEDDERGHGQRQGQASQKMTKAKRKREEARKKADWLAVRASLS